MLTYEDPPENTRAMPTKQEIAAELTENVGKWAVVARHDRLERAMRHADRIKDGAEYGLAFEAVSRSVGNEHRVYARHVRPVAG